MTHQNDEAVKAQLEAAQDMLEGMQNQRNAAHNECVQIAAQLKAAHRKIQTLEQTIAGLEAPKEDQPSANGHDAQPEATA